jgi:hypothetical protein
MCCCSFFVERVRWTLNISAPLILTLPLFSPRGLPSWMKDRRRLQNLPWLQFAISSLDILESRFVPRAYLFSVLGSNIMSFR